MRYVYLSDKNPHGATLPGVPLGDITQETFECYPAWLQRSIEACPFYEKRTARVAATKKREVKHG